MQRRKAAALQEAVTLPEEAVGDDKVTEEVVAGNAEVPVVVYVSEFEVIQQIGNTCAARALIAGLESIYSRSELNDMPGFTDIDERAEGEGSSWIEQHLEACDPANKITVIDNLSLITDNQHHHLKLTELLDKFVPTRTTFGLIVSTGTAEGEHECYGGPRVNQVAARARQHWQHWIYMEVNFCAAPEVYYADSQSNMEQGERRREVIKAAAQSLAVAVDPYLV
jgi:hypothetical protein